MSKFFLPAQKGVELFPTTIVAPPIMRWVGVDARTAEAQAILDQYGSAITSFYVQQAHNHSLSEITQTRAYRQIVPNLGVEYVNQGGMEYVTLYVQPVGTVQEEKKQETPEQPVRCWYPPEMFVPDKSLAEMYVAEEIELPLEYVPHPLYPDIYLPTPFYSGVLPTRFDLPVVFRGISFTHFSVTSNGGGFYVGENAPLPLAETNAWWYDSGAAPAPNYAVIGSMFPRYNEDSRIDYDSETTKIFVSYGVVDTGEGYARKFVRTRYDYSRVNRFADGSIYYSTQASGQHMLVEPLTRAGRGACPALFGESRRVATQDVYSGDSVYGLAVSPCPAESVTAEGTRHYADLYTYTDEQRQAYGGPGIVWSYIDPTTTELVSFLPDLPWFEAI